MVAIKPVAYTGPVYRATPAVQNFTASATTFAVTKQTGVVAGDLILLWAAGAYAAATFTCPGFTAYTASGTVVDAQLLARTADGTEGSTFTLTSSTTTDDVAVTQVTIAGPASIDAIGTAGGITNNVNLFAAGLTVAGSNELLLWFGASVNSSSNGTAITTLPSGFTSRATGTAGTTSLPDVVLADNTAVATGATGTQTGTASSGYYEAYQMVAIRPSPGYRATPAVQNFTSSSTTFVVTKATGTVAGDQILLWCSHSNATYTVSCPGFTASASPSTTLGCTLLSRVADGTESSTFTITLSGSDTGSVLQAVIAGPCSIDVAGAWNYASSGTAIGPNGLTVAGQSELLLWFGTAEQVASPYTAQAITPTAGFTTRVTASGAASIGGMVLADLTAVAPGATGTLANGSIPVSSLWDCQMVAIKPAVVSTQGLLLMLMMS
jgi:hypothetical protein